MPPDADGIAVALLDEALLVGHWDLVSWEREVVATGEVGPARGEQPQGFLAYLPGGRMMTLIVRSDRAPPAGMPPTAAEKAALHDSMLAYAGRWHVEGDVVIHRIDAAWNRVWDGTEQRRHAVLDGAMLTLRTPSFIEPATGMQAIHTLVFRRSG